jgi:hypothetical protein
LFSDPNGKGNLSYEGSFTATNGPANGMTSTDIGITEESNAAVGTSTNQLVLVCTYADFTWQSATATYNAVNNKGQFW